MHEASSMKLKLKLLLSAILLVFFCLQTSLAEEKRPLVSRKEIYVAPRHPKKAPRSSQPNIIFILSDDHRWDYLSRMGHPFIETPNLDRLATEGVHFTNAFCTTSLCSPSRASFLTGQYASTHGVKNNLTPWNDDNVTFLELLKGAGYQTAFIGKWHMPGKLPRLRGVDHFVTFEVVGGQGVYFNCPLIINGNHVPSRKPYITEELTDHTLEFIERNREKPFAVYLSHKAVHAPFTPPPEFNHTYDKAKVPLPEEADAWTGMTRGNFTALQFAPLQNTIRNYAEAVTAMDQQIGRILTQLDQLGISRKTIVVYASDNGYLWGEHQLVDKRWAYEESIRIPFIVRYPEGIDQPGRTAEQMVLNIDVGPSLLDLAGIPVPGIMEGTSLRPILESESAPGRKAWRYEYFKDFFYNIPNINAIRTDTHIYIEYGNRKPPDLFDLMKDPLQKINLTHEAGNEKMVHRLKQLLVDFQDQDTTEMKKMK